MSKTLIGQLILRLRTEGLGEAKKITDTMRDVESAARRLGQTGSSTWGAGFQRQLNSLKLTANEIQEVERSWTRLHEAIRSRNLAGAMKSAEVGHWKTNTISVLAQGRAEMDRHMKLAEDSAKSHATRMRDILKPGLVMMGAYSAPYFAGILGLEAMTASSERRREIFRQRMAGISQDDQDKLYEKSEAVSAKYPSIPITGVMEMSRSAFSVMGDAERAAAVLEKMAESLVVMQSARGVDAAAQQLIGLIRGLDNLGANKDGQVGIDQVNDMIDAATRAAQVDPDFDPQGFFNFARATKTAGPALSMDFLARAPVYIQDNGDGTAGNNLAMGFRAFVLEAVGSAGGKKYLAERDRIGIRKNGELVDKELFGSDPDKWVLKHLIPALQRDGVDLNNDTLVSAAVGELSGNSTATGFMARVIQQREQTERWLKLMDGAMGTDAAAEVRHEDPFVGWMSFKKALENLSAAMVPIDAINAGLNGLADGINKLAAVAKDNPFLVSLGLLGAGAGALKGGQFALGKMSDMFGLKGSALALDGSAAALTRAAVALGGAGVADGLGGVGDGKGKPSSKVGRAAKYGALAAGPGTMLYAVDQMLFGGAGSKKLDENVSYASAFLEALGKLWNKELRGEEASAERKDIAGPSLREQMAIKLRPGHKSYAERSEGPQVDTGSMDDAQQKALQTGQGILDALNVAAKPVVDLASLQEANRLVQSLKAGLDGLNAAARTARNSAGAEMRRNFSDRGGGGGW